MRIGTIQGMSPIIRKKKEKMFLQKNYFEKIRYYDLPCMRSFSYVVYHIELGVPQHSNLHIYDKIIRKSFQR